MRILTCLLLLWPTFAAAQNVTVRSGEHETFSRLVLSIGESTSWSVEPSPEGAVLILEDRAAVFEIGEVFDRIPRDRLQEVTQDGANRLMLQFDCDCHTDAFLWQPGQLVIDVIDGPDPFAVMAVRPPAVRPTLPDLLALDPGDKAINSIDQSIFANPDDPERSEELRATEQALMEGLARAASQGFLETAVTVPTPDREQPEAEAQVLPEPEPELPRPSPHPGVGVSTALDRDLAELGDLFGHLTDQACLPADLFQFRDWAVEGSFHSDISTALLALDGEFGQMPADAPENVAKTYLYYGFGVEARMALSLDPASSQQRQALTELSYLIDGEQRPLPMLRSQARCNTPAALWAFLSEPAQLSEELRNQILQDYFSLPQPLRGQIAPRLANGFLTFSDTEAADKILRSAHGHDVAETHEAQSAQATLAEESGQPDVALAVLEEEADDNARTTPASVIRLINLALDQGEVPSQQELVLAAALRQEFRNDPIARELAVAEALGQAATGSYEVSLALLDGRDDELALSAFDKIYADMAASADDIALLKAGFASLPDGIAGETRNVLAARMLDAGFPQRAREILAPPAVREAAAERRFLLAEAALALGQTKAVFDQLQGLTDERARALRARAHTAEGDFGSALSALGTAEGAADPVLEFRAEAWDRLTTQQDPALSGFAEAVLDAPPIVDPDSLADRRDVLSQSQATRQAVEDLLVRFDLESASE